MSDDDSMFYCAPEDGCPDGDPCPGHPRTKRRIGWDTIPDDVFEELTNPEFRHRQHHSRSTSRDGCRGPLCRKAERENKARRDARRALEKGKMIKSMPMEKRRPGDIWRDELLNEIFAWHMLERTRPEGVTFGGPEERLRATQSALGLVEQDGGALRGRTGVPGAPQDSADPALRTVLT